MRSICYFLNTDWYFDLHWLDRARYAQFHGYQVHVISDFKNEEILRKLQDLGFICHQLDVKPQSINPFIFFWIFFRSCFTLQRIKPDIIHAATIKPCIYAGLYAFLMKKKLVLSIVGLGRIFTDQSATLSFIRKIVLPFYQIVLKNKKSYIIFEHQDDKRNFIEATGVDEERTIVIDGAGIDTQLFNFQPEVHHQPPVVLFAARLLKQKGLLDLIAAKKILLQRNSDFEICVAGIPVKDSDAIPHEDIIAWDKQGLITWLGKRSDMKSVIAQANIVALPSTYAEGVPRILIESAAIGRALIAYDSGGCCSIIENERNGFLVEKGNIASLADKLEILLLNSERRSVMASYGRDLVLTKFDSKFVLTRTLKIYDLLYNS